MSNTTKTDLLVIAASSGENLKLAQRFADQAIALGHQHMCQVHDGMDCKGT